MKLHSTHHSTPLATSRQRCSVLLVLVAGFYVSVCCPSKAEARETRQQHSSFVHPAKTDRDKHVEEHFSREEVARFKESSGSQSEKELYRWLSLILIPGLFVLLISLFRASLL